MWKFLFASLATFALAFGGWSLAGALSDPGPKPGSTRDTPQMRLAADERRAHMAQWMAKTYGYPAGPSGYQIPPGEFSEARRAASAAMMGFPGAGGWREWRRGPDARPGKYGETVQPDAVLAL